MLKFFKNINNKQIRSLSSYANSHLRFSKEISINGVTENIYIKDNFPSKFITDTLKDKTITTLGYGPQAKSQSLNLRDNGYNVIVGVRKNEDSNSSWQKALKDNWIPDKNLFEIDEATSKGDIVQYLLSDAGQISQWSIIKSNLKKDATLYFSHGFGIVYNNKTDIIPNKNNDVILVAPKGPGIYVRQNFLNNDHVNASWAVHQNSSGNAEKTAISLAFAIGCDNLFETTFHNETTSDLVGERSVLMGLIQGAFKAQYDLLREKGHSPSEAYNETVEEALRTLYPLISDKGMDWMYENCSTTAQRGALDWAPRYYNAIKPVIAQCYQEVEAGMEADIVIKANSSKDYKEKLKKELNNVKDQEIWQAYRVMRHLRPGASNNDIFLL
jgi:ketol-acid reductoisomerase